MKISTVLQSSKGKGVISTMDEDKVKSLLDELEDAIFGDDEEDDEEA